MKCNVDIITLDYHFVCVKVIIANTRGYAHTTKLLANEFIAENGFYFELLSSYCGVLELLSLIFKKKII